jgi:pimeloyl-ACP methyl ester carboxylesterase
LYVPENRAEAGSRVIGVGFARFKARKKTGASPTFHLPGGPGNSYISGLRPGENERRFDMAGPFADVSDVVFVDQRGFSERGGVLKADYKKPALPLDQPGSLARSTEVFAEMARAVVADYGKRKVDLRGYTVLECADDVNDLRQALGYEQITLVGQSFGSQWSFALMRRHPQIVARALLSGVEPLDNGYDMRSHVWASIQRAWWEAEQDPRLKPYLPGGGLTAATRQVLERLRKSPAEVRLAGGVAVTLGPEDFQEELLGLSIDNGPARLLAIYHERYDAWARSVLDRRRNFDFPLIGPLIDTSLGVTPRRKYLLRNDPATEFLGQWNFDAYLATADIWPTADVGDEFRTEQINQTPVVFVHGTWDTQTPLENALGIAPYFPNGRLLIVERGRHAAIKQVLDRTPELFEFLRTGSMQKVPARISLPAPTFAVPDFPAPR